MKLLFWKKEPEPVQLQFTTRKYNVEIDYKDRLVRINGADDCHRTRDNWLIVEDSKENKTNYYNISEASSVSITVIYERVK